MTRGKYDYRPSKCAAMTSTGGRCTAPRSCWMLLAGFYGDKEPELLDSEVAATPKHPVSACLLLPSRVVRMYL